jgi:hypothetical protein
VTKPFDYGIKEGNALQYLRDILVMYLAHWKLRKVISYHGHFGKTDFAYGTKTENVLPYWRDILILFRVLWKPGKEISYHGQVTELSGCGTKAVNPLPDWKGIQMQ